MRNLRRALCTTLTLLSAGILLASTADAAPNESTRVRPHSVFELEIQIEGGVPFQVTVWEGQAATLRSERHDLSLVVVPSITDRLSGEVSFWIGEPVGQRAEGLVIRPVGEAAAQVGFRQPLAHLPVNVEVMEVREPTRAERMQAPATELRDSFIMYRKDGPSIVSQGTCCLRCASGDQLCGCCVKAPCGVCTGGCCSY